MKKLIDSNSNIIRISENIEIHEDSYKCDGVIYYKSVFGECTVEETEENFVYIRNAEELSFSIREQRNKLLAESDWTQVADAPVDKAAWATYRKALRDITEQDGFPGSVEFPAEP